MSGAGIDWGALGNEAVELLRRNVRAGARAYTEMLLAVAAA